MLIDFPEARNKIRERLADQWARQTIANTPIVSYFSSRVIYEGNRVLFRQADGAEHVIYLEAHETEFEVDSEGFESASPEAVTRAIERASARAAAEMEGDLFRLLEQVGPESGLVFKGQGIDGFRQNFLKAIETMQVEFDADGKPELIITTSNRELGHQLAEADFDDDLERQIQAAIEAKRHEWIVRESRRRLAD